MKQSIGYVSLVVRDYDEAIDFYVKTLDFVLIEDTFIEAQNKRWVLLAPPGSTESRLLLARAVGPEQQSRIALAAAPLVGAQRRASKVSAGENGPAAPRALP